MLVENGVQIRLNEVAVKDFPNGRNPSERFLKFLLLNSPLPEMVDLSFFHAAI